ncbi:MAG: arylesterase [Steroidobacteraceae bacterium]|nr:arylesterase [Steroidobacteraceae bacterium]
MIESKFDGRERPSLRLVDPELLPWLEAMPDETWGDAMLPGRRALIVALAAANKPPLRPDVELEERYLRRPDGDGELRLVIVRPRAHRTPSAPETPYPGALDDGYTALAWLHREARALGVDRDRIALSGDSAGGGLVAGLALLARDRGEHAIAFQHLVFPGLDDRTCMRRDLSPFVGQFIWTQASNVYAWRALLGTEPGVPDVPAYAAPARARDLAGLPPACVQVGALDLFVDEDFDYARRLVAAGVSCELHVYAGAPHGFPMSWRAAVSRACERDGLAALRRGLRIEHQP